MRQKLPKSVPFFLFVLLFAALSVGYLLPLCLPFLLGAALALVAEPTVRLFSRRLKLPRRVSSPIAVSTVFLFGICVLVLLLAIVGRQMQKLGAILPTMVDAVQTGSAQLKNWLLRTAAQLPGDLGPTAAALTEHLFSNSASMLEQATAKLPNLAGSVLSGLSGGLLWLITGIISACMISSRLPTIRQWLQTRLPAQWQEKLLPAAKAIRQALGGWLLAEAKLAGIAFLFLSVGFLLLRIENGFVWAMLITLVDAFPILGVGTVLLPWSAVCLLQGNHIRAIGLLALYGALWLTRSILEPKLIGKGLGLDPLVTLIAIYVGWKLWGISGMLLAPFLTLATIQLSKQLQG